MHTQKEHYLSRMKNLVEIRKNPKAWDLLNETGKALWRKSAGITMMDCLEAGCGKEAFKMLSFLGFPEETS